MIMIRGSRCGAVHIPSSHYMFSCFFMLFGWRVQSKLRFLALQAPVSDREHMAMVPTATDYVSMAREMQAGGKGSEMLPREAMWAPITADRFLDLSTKVCICYIYTLNIYIL